MKKKNSHSNNSNLYVTKDIYTPAYFARTDVEKFARFCQINGEWAVWFYPYSYQIYLPKLTDVINKIDRLFKIYWYEKYGSKCDTQ